MGSLGTKREETVKILICNSFAFQCDIESRGGTYFQGKREIVRFILSVLSEVITVVEML